MDVTSDTFIKLGNKYTKSSLTRSAAIALRRFKAHFGVTPIVCSIIWEHIKNELPPGAEAKHLLWTLLFLKTYVDEHNRHSLFGADEKTIRKWTWIFIKHLSELNVVTLLSNFWARCICL